MLSWPRRFQEHAMDAGAEFIMAEVTGISRDGPHKLVSADAANYRAKAVIVSAGFQSAPAGNSGRRRVFTAGECPNAPPAMALFYMGLVVGVVGGGDSAADEAMSLTEYADRVLLFHYQDQLQAQKVLQDRLHLQRKIEVVWNTEVKEVLGEGNHVRSPGPQRRHQLGKTWSNCPACSFTWAWSPTPSW